MPPLSRKCNMQKCRKHDWQDSQWSALTLSWSEVTSRVERPGGRLWLEEVGAREPFTFGRHLHLAGRVVVSSKAFCWHFFSNFWTLWGDLKGNHVLCSILLPVGKIAPYAMYGNFTHWQPIIGFLWPCLFFLSAFWPVNLDKFLTLQHYHWATFTGRHQKHFLE